MLKRPIDVVFPDDSMSRTRSREAASTDLTIFDFAFWWSEAELAEPELAKLGIV